MMRLPRGATMDAMKYHDLRDFLTLLGAGELKRITLPVDPHLEITEIADRTLRRWWTGVAV